MSISEHLIRLRGGWERLGPPNPTTPSRVTLPLLSVPEGRGRLRLSRSFQSPRLDPARESLWLRLDAVPGLVSVVLNGREIVGPTALSALLLPLGVDLPPRNVLILDAEVPPMRGFAWGEVALAIRQTEKTG